MGNSVRNVCAVIVDPHGLTGRDRSACARGVLDRDCAVSGVVDDIRLLNRRDYKVIPSSSSTCQVKAQVTRRLACVGIRQRKRDIRTSEGYTRRSRNSFPKGYV